MTYLLLLPKFRTNLLTLPTFMLYISAMTLQYFDNMSLLISSFSGTNGYH